ncbi:serine hydrolase [bacterium]|nr:serine hydrolase [bacterium]
MTASTVHGFTDPRFAALRHLMAEFLAEGVETGGAVAVSVNGRLVADLWGGHADAAGHRPWQRDTLVNVWSVTKGISALALAILADRGKLDYRKPVARYWPEFAANGKEAITLDTALSHQAGLNGLSVPMDMAGLCAGAPYARAVAEMAPLWQPGSRCVYHSITMGTLMAEPLRRIDGRSIGRFVAEEIAGPLGVPFHIGLPEDEEPMVAELSADQAVFDAMQETLDSPYPQAGLNPEVPPLAPNARAWRAAEIPGANGQSHARALAMIYGDLVAERSRLISAAGLDEALRMRFDGVDAGGPVIYGAGFRLNEADYGRRGPKTTFGHPGWGGSIAFADPEARMGFAFVTARMRNFGAVIDPRRKRLIDAAYDALGRAGG